MVHLGFHCPPSASFLRAQAIQEIAMQYVPLPSPRRTTSNRGPALGEIGPQRLLDRPEQLRRSQPGPLAWDAHSRLDTERHPANSPWPIR